MSKNGNSNQTNYEHLFSSGLTEKTLRLWQSGNSNHHRAEDFVLPLFLINNKSAKNPILNFPLVYQFGLDKLIEYLDPLYQIGLKSVLLFPVMNQKGVEYAFSEQTNPLLTAIKVLKQRYTDLIFIADVCLCPFSVDRQCCFFTNDGHIEHEKTLDILSRLSLLYAQAGVHILAPSDMIDGRIKKIKQTLLDHKLDHVAIMSYSAKYSSCLYEPFRNALRPNDNTKIFRNKYQLPIGSKSLGLRSAERDIAEGANFVMIKPGLFYLDIIKTISDNHPNFPIVVYQVSGEYAMIFKASEHGLFDLNRCIYESIVAFKRAGASIIITYFTPIILDLIYKRQFDFN